MPANAALTPQAAAICQPAEPHATTRVKQYSRAFTFWMLGTLALTLGSAIWGIAVSPEEEEVPMTLTQIVAYSAFAIGMAAMLLVLFAFHPLHDVMLRRRLIARTGAQLPAGRGKVYRVCFAHLFHLKDKQTDDVAVVAADPAQRQLVIEGVRYRYLIPASAIRSLLPLQSDTTLALELHFILADECEMKLVLARENMKGHWQSHLPFISAANDAAKAAARLREQLNIAA